MAGQHAMRVEGAFGKARGAGGVDDQRRVVGPRPDGLEILVVPGERPFLRRALGNAGGVRRSSQSI